MKIIKSIIGFLRDPLGVEKMVAEFREKFPGKCMICANHRYGLSNGYASEPNPKDHDCIEAKAQPEKV